MYISQIAVFTYSTIDMNNEYLVSLDIKPLYTNIPVDALTST